MGDRSRERDAAAGVTVANSTPLINLAAIGQLDLLAQLYGSIVVPDEVWQELRSGNERHPTFRAVEESGFIQTAALHDRALFTSLTEHLDEGEAAAITLAVELQATWLLLDEREARAAARRLGCRILGTLGIVASAKLRGLIPAAAPVIQEVIDKARFHVSPELVARVLADLGEA